MRVFPCITGLCGSFCGETTVPRLGVIEPHLQLKSAMNLSLGQRRRMLREINTEFDVIIDSIAQESGNNPKAFVGSCEMKYPLTAGSGIFKGKKPAAVIIGGECVAVRTWRQLVGEIMIRCISIPAYRIAPESLAGKVSGKKRGVLSCCREARSCADPHAPAQSGRDG